MAFLLVVVFAAVLTSVLSDGIISFPRLEQKRKTAEEACRHLISDMDALCHLRCLYESYGAIDKKGRYNETGGFELMLITLGVTFRGKIPGKDPLHTVKKASKVCNILNDKIAEGCSRSSDVLNCLTNEFNKMLMFEVREEKKASAKAACGHLDPKDKCHTLCVYKSYKVLDESGKYDEKHAIDLVAATYPDLRPQIIEKVVNECNFALFKARKSGCDRALQVSQCLAENYRKLIVLQHKFAGPRAGMRGKENRKKN